MKDKDKISDKSQVTSTDNKFSATLGDNIMVKVGAFKGELRVDIRKWCPNPTTIGISLKV